MGILNPANIRKKSKVVLVHTMRACRGTRGAAPLILKLSIKWREVVYVVS